MSAGTAFARAASQPRVSGVRDFCMAADSSRHHRAIKHNLACTVDASLAPPAGALLVRRRLRSAVLKRLRRGSRAVQRSSRYSGENHQRTLAPEPPAPGPRAPSSGSLSPGTAAPLCELDRSVVTSSLEAQAEIRNAIAKNRAAEKAKRLVTGTNLTTGMFDASATVR